MRAEDAAARFHPEGPHPMNEMVIEPLPLLGGGRSDKGGTPALPAVPVKGELRDQKRSAADIKQGPVHPPLPGYIDRVCDRGQRNIHRYENNRVV